MQYKTIVLTLLQQHPTLHDQLRQERRLLATVDQAALELKANHETLIEELTQLRPQDDPRQISSQAFEMAMKEMEERLLPASEREATAHAISHSPRG